jgi:hypothetical protein
MPTETPHPLWYRKRPPRPPSARNPTTDAAIKILKSHHTGQNFLEKFFGGGRFESIIPYLWFWKALNQLSPLWAISEWRILGAKKLTTNRKMAIQSIIRVTHYTLYIGLAKDQRIGIWIVTLGRRGR